MGPLWLFRINRPYWLLGGEGIGSTALTQSAVSQQAGGDSIEYNESPGRADQKEQFSNNDFHVILNLHHRPKTEKT
jgi:hypothetical protein